MTRIKELEAELDNLQNKYNESTELTEQLTHSLDDYFFENNQLTKELDLIIKCLLQNDDEIEHNLFADLEACVSTRGDHKIYKSFMKRIKVIRQQTDLEKNADRILLSLARGGPELVDSGWDENYLMDESRERDMSPRDIIIEHLEAGTFPHYINN